MPFGMIGVEEPFWRPSCQRGAELPAKVERVLQPGVHALRTGRGMGMGRVAGKKIPGHNDRWAAGGPRYGTAPARTCPSAPDRGRSPARTEPGLGATGERGAEGVPDLAIVLFHPRDLPGPCHLDAKLARPGGEQRLDLALRDVEQVREVRVEVAKRDRGAA